MSRAHAIATTLVAIPITRPTCLRRSACVVLASELRVGLRDVPEEAQTG
jgi:hypothetical protein